MPLLTRRTARYARAWLSHRNDLVEDELTLDRDGTPVPATLVRPKGSDTDLRAWVVMHGITRPGRAHAQLVRFTHAVASAGMATITPEVPEWRELDLAPGLTAPTIAAAIRGLRDTGVVRDAPVGVVGFSFGAPHTITAAAHPTLKNDIAGACGFGGYCSVEHSFRFMVTGRHEWNGQTYQLQPDPYGRWIVAANYLTAIPEHSAAGDVADALRALAKYSGDIGVASWDPVYDPRIRELRSGVAEERRELFDIFATESDATVDEEKALGLIDRLTAAARRVDPALDPTALLHEVEGPVHLLHGRGDRLIPFSESHRLAAALALANPRLTVTRLFGHSAQDDFPVAQALMEIPKFTRALGAVLATV